MEQANLAQAQEEIVYIVAQDFSTFIPTDDQSRHFDPASIILIFAGLLLTAYLKGFTAGAQSAAEDAGKKTVPFIVDAVKKLWTSPPKSADADLKQAKAAADEALKTMTPEQKQKALKAGLDTTQSVLVELKMNSRKAEKIAIKIQDVALVKVLQIKVEA